MQQFPLPQPPRQGHPADDDAAGAGLGLLDSIADEVEAIVTGEALLAGDAFWWADPLLGLPLSAQPPGDSTPHPHPRGGSGGSGGAESGSGGSATVTVGMMDDATQCRGRAAGATGTASVSFSQHSHHHWPQQGGATGSEPGPGAGAWAGGAGGWPASPSPAPGGGFLPQAGLPQPPPPSSSQQQPQQRQSQQLQQQQQHLAGPGGGVPSFAGAAGHSFGFPLPDADAYHFAPGGARGAGLAQSSLLGGCAGMPPSSLGSGPHLAGGGGAPFGSAPPPSQAPPTEAAGESAFDVEEDAGAELEHFGSGGVGASSESRKQRSLARRAAQGRAYRSQARQRRDEISAKVAELSHKATAMTFESGHSAVVGLVVDLLDDMKPVGEDKDK